MTEDKRFLIFAICWLAIAALYWWVLYINTNLGLKKTVHHLIILGLPILFCGFVLWVGQQVWPLFIIVPFCCLGVWWTLKHEAGTFCESCSAVLRNPMNPFVNPKTCRKCGAEVDANRT
jgi:hypothetical protein